MKKLAVGQRRAGRPTAILPIPNPADRNDRTSLIPPIGPPIAMTPRGADAPRRQSPRQPKPAWQSEPGREAHEPR